jgi:Xaa-Pro aminopeptidase
VSAVGTAETDQRAEVEGKISAVREWLGRRDFDGVVIGSQTGFAWITGGGDSHVSLGDAAGVAAVLVTATDAVVLCANNERARLAEEELRGLPFRRADFLWHRPDSARDLVAEAADPARVVSDLGSHGLAAAPPDLAELRYALGQAEVRRYRSLGREAAEALEIATREAVPGDPELDVAGRLASECRRRGILPLVVLVAADERIIRYRHPVPTGNPLRRALLVALTGRRHGLHASLTRMRAVDEADPELDRRHAATARIDARLILASRSGRTLGEAFQEGLDQYRVEGFPEEWRLHHQGGLTGYGGREIFAVPGQAHPLGAGQALAWNPSITGAKSEDTILIGEAGAEVLTRTKGWPQMTAEVRAGAVERPALLEGGAR